VRVLAIADARPHRPVAEVVAACEPELVVLLGDLEPAWIEDLAAIDLPKLGVHGNHDAVDALSAVGAEDIHLRQVEHGGLTFAGLAGSRRYSREGHYEWTDEEAEELIARLPGADVLLTHTPPAGVNDEPDDVVHRGWAALVPWLERERPAWLLHGHTHPRPDQIVHRVGDTQVAYVRGAAILELTGRAAR
jgi:Icc-related predicted phosphoesterase